jgi:hypothetical protein
VGYKTIAISECFGCGLNVDRQIHFDKAEKQMKLLALNGIEGGGWTNMFGDLSPHF